MLVEKQAGDGITLAAALEWQDELDFSKGFGTVQECLWDQPHFYFKENLMQRRTR